MSVFYFEVDKFEKMLDIMEKFSDKAQTERVINEYLHEKGGEIIRDNIQKILPVSGRTWRGKKPAASQTNPFLIKKENLAVVVKTKGTYNYLYFPDDGTNTEHHAGNQQFMFRGATDSQDRIVNEVIDELVKRLEET
jgi:hypothetical protein|nr:MAG TPA: type I neck protein [Caudoviricetes sp.]